MLETNVMPNVFQWVDTYQKFVIVQQYVILPHFVNEIPSRILHVCLTQININLRQRQSDRKLKRCKKYSFALLVSMYNKIWQYTYILL